jgi:diguanylate cyclase (GGDEF)-like protein
MHININKKNIIVICAVIGLVVFLGLVIGMTYVLKVEKQNETLSLTNQYVDFQNEIESIVYNNITIIYGYLADAYLSNLFEDHETYIKNVAILEDTTIIWNYPIEGNETSIGVDLATIDGQSETVLQVKETLNSTFNGPVKLVQGGIGFIARLPIIKEGQYWGQVSLVIDGDAFYKDMKNSADDNDLSLMLYNINDYPDKAFYMTTGIIKSDALTFDFNVDLVSWKVVLIPRDGWRNNTIQVVIGSIISLLASIAIALLIYNNLFNHELTKYQANHDFLTGLYNRTFLDEFQNLVLSKAKRNNGLVGFILIDVNRFKVINDKYGHIVGDELLKMVAINLKKTIRSHEAVFRLGGDEYLLVLPEIQSLEELRHVMKRIMLTCLEPKVIDHQEIEVTVSIGSSIYPIDGTNFDDLLKIADKNMYEHKSEKDILI